MVNASIPRLIQFCDPFPINFTFCTYFWRKPVWGLLGAMNLFFLLGKGLGKLNDDLGLFLLDDKVREQCLRNFCTLFGSDLPRVPFLVVWVLWLVSEHRSTERIFEKLLHFCVSSCEPNLRVVVRGPMPIAITNSPNFSTDSQESISINCSSKISQQCIFHFLPFLFALMGRVMCKYSHILFFLQVGKKRAGRLLDGREWNAFPDVATGTP